MTRTYVITGSASGIGLATAELLSSLGHRVIGIDREDADVVVDLADRAGREGIGERVAHLADDAVDGVIAVAGTAALEPIGAQVNFFGARDTLEQLQPLLRESATGRAVVVSSISAIHPHHPPLTDALLNGDEAEAMRIAESLVAEGNGGYIYTSSKRAIAKWVRTHAVGPDWAGAGIALNTVAPGTVVTPMTAPALSTGEGRAAVARMVPMPLNGPAQPSSAAALLAWLTSAENTHVTGQTIFLDGGAEAVLRGADVFETAQ